MPVNIPIPVLTMPGAIPGGLSGAVQRQIQEFRDALTRELASADNNAISDDGLALDVFWELQELPGLDSGLFAPTTPVPEDTDAVLYVHFNDIEIYDRHQLVYFEEAVPEPRHTIAMKSGRLHPPSIKLENAKANARTRQPSKTCRNVSIG